MRAALLLVPALALPVLFLAGCGYAGEPKPPSLKRPLKVSELAAVERGSKIVVTFRLPKETTEGLPIDLPPDIEMRAGLPPAGDWNVAEWEAHSERLAVPDLIIPPGGLASASRTRTPKAPRAHSGAAAPKANNPARFSKTKATFAPLPPAYFDRTVRFDAAKYSGKTVVIGVRVRSPRGRDDGWSIVQLAVVPVLPVPLNTRATDAAHAVHLQWSIDGAPTGFRIYRKLQDETDWGLIGESAKPAFDDPAPAYGKPTQYYVETFSKAGEKVTVSDQSQTITFTAQDRFPPAVPAGLGGIVGAKAIELFWDRVEDSDLAGYRVFRDGKRIADAVVNSVYSDKDVAAGTKYRYEVSAVDQTGNESQKSAAVELTME